MNHSQDDSVPHEFITSEGHWYEKPQANKVLRIRMAPRTKRGMKTHSAEKQTVLPEVFELAQLGSRAVERQKGVDGEQSRQQRSRGLLRPSCKASSREVRLRTERGN